VNAAVLGALPWIAAAWVLLWTVDRIVSHIRWPQGEVVCCEHCASTVDLANDSQEMRASLGDVHGRLEETVEVLTEIRDGADARRASMTDELRRVRTALVRLSEVR
jgi:hypothetical protein